MQIKNSIMDEEMNAEETVTSSPQKYKAIAPCFGLFFLFSQDIFWFVVSLTREICLSHEETHSGRRKIYVHSRRIPRVFVLDAKDEWRNYPSYSK